MTTDLFTQLDSNPLLKGLPELMTHAQWAQILRYDPSCEWKSISISTLTKGVFAAEQIMRLFVPTQIAIQIAWGIHEMLVLGLQARDPRNNANRRRVYEIGAHRGQDIARLPWYPSFARGMTIKGITQLGKSHVVQRVLHQFPQVILRDADEEGAWSSLQQLIHLTVPMPADASRRGFLLAAFKCIDEALGTAYAQQYARDRTSVESQLVHLAVTLAVHRCGLLVIEEAQEVNVTSSVFGKEFLTFFLRLLNLGIPVIMVGNPEAFKLIDCHSQNLSRLSEGGSYTLEPASIHHSRAWAKDLVPGIWGWNPLSLEEEVIPSKDEYLWVATGGFPGYLARLRSESIKIALIEGGGRITIPIVEKARRSASMKEVQPVIDAFVTKNLAKLREFIDIPTEHFAEKWREEARMVAVAESSRAASEPDCHDRSKVRPKNSKNSESSTSKNALGGGDEASAVATYSAAKMANGTNSTELEDVIDSLRKLKK